LDLSEGCINTSSPPLLEVSCSFVQLRNTFEVQGSARALVRIKKMGVLLVRIKKMGVLERTGHGHLFS
jgi:hypothetical protein